MNAMFASFALNPEPPGVDAMAAVPSKPARMVRLNASAALMYGIHSFVAFGAQQSESACT